MALHKLSLCDLQKKFTAGDVSAVEIVRAYALRIGQVESKVRAYVNRVQDSALAQADALDRQLKQWRKTKPLIDRKSTRLNSSHIPLSRMPSSA